MNQNYARSQHPPDRMKQENRMETNVCDIDLRCVRCVWEELSTRWLQPTPCDGKPGLLWEEGEEGTGCVAATNTERN